MHLRPDITAAGPRRPHLSPTCPPLTSRGSGQTLGASLRFSPHTPLSSPAHAPAPFHATPQAQAQTRLTRRPSSPYRTPPPLPTPTVASGLQVLCSEPLAAPGLQSLGLRLVCSWQGAAAAAASAGPPPGQQWHLPIPARASPTDPPAPLSRWVHGALWGLHCIPERGSSAPSTVPGTY